MNEQILINYTKNEGTFLLSIIKNGEPVCYTSETPEAVELINKIKEVLNDVD